MKRKGQQNWKKREREKQVKQTPEYSEETSTGMYMCVHVVCLHSGSFSAVLLAVCGIQCLSNPPGNRLKLPKCHPAPLFTLYHPTAHLSLSPLFPHFLSAPLSLPLAVSFISFHPNYFHFIQFHLSLHLILPVFLCPLFRGSSSLYSCRESS